MRSWASTRRSRSVDSEAGRAGAFACVMACCAPPQTMSVYLVSFRVRVPRDRPARCRGSERWFQARELLATARVDCRMGKNVLRGCRRTLKFEALFDAKWRDLMPNGSIVTTVFDHPAEDPQFRPRLYVRHARRRRLQGAREKGHGQPAVDPV